MYFKSEYYPTYSHHSRSSHMKSSSLNLHLQPLQRQEVAAEDDRVDGRVHGVHVTTRYEQGTALVDDYLKLIAIFTCILAKSTLRENKLQLSVVFNDVVLTFQHCSNLSPRNTVAWWSLFLWSWTIWFRYVLAFNFYSSVPRKAVGSSAWAERRRRLSGPKKNSLFLFWYPKSLPCTSLVLVHTYLAPRFFYTHRTKRSPGTHDTTRTTRRNRCGSRWSFRPCRWARSVRRQDEKPRASDRIAQENLKHNRGCHTNAIF